MGLGDKWGHGAGRWGGFRGPAWWNETSRVTLGDTGLGHGWVQGTSGDMGLGHAAWWNETFRVTLGDTGHMVLGDGVGLGDQHGGIRPLG